MSNENRRASKKQKELLSFVETFIAGHGYGPSYREIQRGLNYKSVSTVAIHIDNLIAKGYLIKRERSARSLSVVRQPAIEATGNEGVTPQQEKWLVDLVFARFDALGQNPSAKAIDELYVLTGAMQILGLSGAATAAKARLAALAGAESVEK